jgi:hypothetical protein
MLLLRSNSMGPVLGARISAATVGMVKPGKYRHYKGGLYEVVGVARHSETEEELVVYRALYGEGGLWVRPRAMFDETVRVDGREEPRFTPVD